ncbi:hypothetical protein CkaCkLH20_02016 [Colletotrichum karsti]|uniref:AAA+ ATPase domain-containing protein n=1 Tax=Colletotrichum karsti TaxID=1095194 RepID=A0A9P6IAX3_9PEZI|nr:uncharacterized protein CkaCkLH20_02016 [Colletotrichum karsti]KAF9880062.1 hypothetical protein CkaCkLH20_02016 [Colletotrichum karsti]
MSGSLSLTQMSDGTAGTMTATEQNTPPASPIGMDTANAPVEQPAEQRHGKQKMNFWDEYGHGMVKHKIEYVSATSDRLKRVFDKEIEPITDEEEPAVFEYIEVRIAEDLHETDTKEHEPRKYHTKYKGNAYIRVISPAVSEALRCVVDCYPGIDLGKNVITVPEPFCVFVHYEKELTTYRQRLEHRASTEPSSCANRFAYKHIGIVQEFVRQQTSSAVEEERERHARGYATFRMLWLLYKPGSEVYVDLERAGDPNPYIIKEVDFTLANGSTSIYHIRYWNLDANEEFVFAADDVFHFADYPGEKKIDSLPLYPCEYLRFAEGVTDQDIQQIRAHFVERGRKWYKTRQKPQCYYFDGLTTNIPREQYSSLVWVDPIQFDADSDNTRSNQLLATLEFAPGPLKICSCDDCERDIYKHAVTPRFSDISNLNPHRLPDMSDELYFLCSPEIEAFVFKTRTWQLLHADGFQPATFEKNLFDRLVLSPETKDLIRNLTAMYIKNDLANQLPTSDEHLSTQNITTIHKKSPKTGVETSWSTDFIKGKGEGLTFLLHGKPGVGKTYTAECIAQYTSRPLLSLTTSDIGVHPDKIEDNLTRWFKLAEKWGAIMLIDEADIYMERREVRDLSRNHLVAGFLRALEYYKGILFLTTNRVGTFDEAFISRIHIQIYYRPFSDEDREKVWDTFFQKLEEERETTIRIMQSTKDYIQSDELKALEWNGREIRNAFQVAVALAEARAEKDSKGKIMIKPEHIKASAQMSKEFKHYLTKLHKQDPSKLAASMGNRYDAFGEPETPRATGEKKY